MATGYLSGYASIVTPLRVVIFFVIAILLWQIGIFVRYCRDEFIWQRQRHFLMSIGYPAHAIGLQMEAYRQEVGHYPQTWETLAHHNPQTLVHSARLLGSMQSAQVIFNAATGNRPPTVSVSSSRGTIEIIGQHVIVSANLIPPGPHRLEWLEVSR